MSDMKHDSKFQEEHEKALEEHRAERAKAALKASEERVATPGWPVNVEGVSEPVFIVRKEAEGQRIVLIAEDGSRYVRTLRGPVVKLDDGETPAEAEPTGDADAEPEAEESEEGESE